MSIQNQQYTLPDFRVKTDRETGILLLISAFISISDDFRMTGDGRFVLFSACVPSSYDFRVITDWETHEFSFSAVFQLSAISFVVDTAILRIDMLLEPSDNRQFWQLITALEILQESYWILTTLGEILPMLIPGGVLKLFFNGVCSLRSKTPIHV